MSRVIELSSDEDDDVRVLSVRAPPADDDVEILVTYENGMYDDSVFAALLERARADRERWNAAAPPPRPPSPAVSSDEEPPPPRPQRMRIPRRWAASLTNTLAHPPGAPVELQGGNITYPPSVTVFVTSDVTGNLLGPSRANIEMQARIARAQPDISSDDSATGTMSSIEGDRYNAGVVIYAGQASVSMFDRLRQRNVGEAVLGYSPSSLFDIYLDHIIIDRHWQGRGLARRALESAFDAAVAQYRSEHNMAQPETFGLELISTNPVAAHHLYTSVAEARGFHLRIVKVHPWTFRQYRPSYTGDQPMRAVTYYFSR